LKYLGPIDGLGGSRLFDKQARLLLGPFPSNRAGGQPSCSKAGALSGPVLPADDKNLLYRIDRVHMNAVEALTPFIVPAVLAMLVGVWPAVLAALVWIYVAIRLIHVAVYLRGGNAAKGGSVRTILYVSGALVTIVLIGATAVAAIH
jgi:uncharacterized MAPEG superfamily protein